MNFLAHLYLSGKQPETICGNFIGDGVKGNISERYDPDVQKGIALHRFIDHYTDNHPITHEARKIIRPVFRKYAGVVLDVYFDHYLGINWNNYHPENLESFVNRMEKLLESFESEMPQKSRRFFAYMRSSRCLINYRDMDSLSMVFHGMASRTPFQSNMEHAIPVLRSNYDELEEAFQAFFPELITASEKFLLSKNR